MVSYHYKILHMAQQHSCHAMCKISKQSLQYNLEEQNEISIKFDGENS